MAWMQIVFNGVAQGLLIGIMGLSFALVFDSTRVFHVAFAAVYTLPPFVWWATLRAGWPWAAGAALAILAGVAVALLCETVNHSRLERIKASEDLHFVASLGTYIFIVQAIVIAWGNEAKFIHSGAHPTKQLLGVLLPRSQIISSVILLGLTVVLIAFFYGTRFGLKLRALAENSVQVALQGHNVRRLRAAVFGLSGLLAAAASLLTAYDVGFDPFIGLNALLLAVVSTVVGGRGTFFGPLLGGLLVGLFRSQVVWLTASTWKDGATFIILVVFLFWRPWGLLGRKDRLEAAA